MGLSFEDQELINWVIIELADDEGKVSHQQIQHLRKEKIQHILKKNERVQQSFLQNEMRPIDRIEQFIIHEIMAKIEEFELLDFAFVRQNLKQSQGNGGFIPWSERSSRFGEIRTTNDIRYSHK